MTTITYTYTQTHRVMSILSKALVATWIGFVAFGETAGRARAAAELSRMGHHAEAKRLMTEKY